ncbi:MAG: GNAT family N-acetyltransferase, partial [Kiloniellales bacterium]
MTESDQGASTLAIRPYEAGDRSALLALWRVSDLIRKWNDPAADIERWLGAENATILVGLLERELVASIAVGHDGHRGWLYYLAVKPALRKRGHGRALVAAAEDWL